MLGIYGALHNLCIVFVVLVVYCVLVPVECIYKVARTQSGPVALSCTSPTCDSANPTHSEGVSTALDEHLRWLKKEIKQREDVTNANGAVHRIEL